MIRSSKLLQKLGDGISVGQGPSEIDGNATYIEFAEHESTVTLNVQPQTVKRNYLTVKLWGGSGKKGELHIQGSDDKQLLSKQRGKNPVPERFYYMTAPIPKPLTKELPATVNITYTGHDGKTPGPKLFDVQVHAQPFYAPARNELQGKPFQPASSRPSGNTPSTAERVKHWKKQANRGIEAARKHQIYGEKADKLIENGPFPEWTRGAFLHQWPDDTELRGPYKDLDSEAEAYGGYLIRQGNGSGLKGAMQWVKLIAEGYVNKWSDYYHDEEMLDRFAAALDFLSLAQGTNGLLMVNRHYDKDRYPGGGFQGWPRWIGAPDRGKGKGIFSNGQKHLWPAYLLMHEPLKKHGYLKKPFPHDLDPALHGKPRGFAYAKMAKRSMKAFEGLVRDRKIANQVLHNFIPYVRTYNALQRLAPSEARKFEGQIREDAKIAVGQRKHPNGDWYMQSPAGIANEFGWAGNYGAQHPRQMTEVAELLDWGFIRKKTRKAFQARAHFFYLRNDSSGHRRMTRPEWISRRNFVGLPGRQEYMAYQYAATELKIPAAIRSFELKAKHNRGRSNLRRAEEIGEHGWLSDGARKAALRAENPLKNLPSTNYRFPFERNGNTAFVDPYMEAASIFHGDRILQARFFISGSKVRLVYRRPEFNRYAEVRSNGFGPDKPGDYFKGKVAKMLLYGPYLIVFNGSMKKSVEVSIPERIQGKQARDLRNGKPFRFEDTTSLKPMSSYVFYIPSRDPQNE